MWLLFQIFNSAVVNRLGQLVKELGDNIKEKRQYYKECRGNIYVYIYFYFRNLKIYIVLDNVLTCLMS